MPLPNSAVIPFMELQSAVMARAFGFNFQFGKRLVSAMNNEHFNLLAAGNQDTLDEEATRMNYYLEEDEKRFFTAINSQNNIDIQNIVIEKGMAIEDKKIDANIELFGIFLDKVAQSGNNALVILVNALLKGAGVDVVINNYGETVDAPTDKEPEPKEKEPGENKEEPAEHDPFEPEPKEPEPEPVEKVWTLTFVWTNPSSPETGQISETETLTQIEHANAIRTTNALAKEYIAQGGGNYQVGSQLLAYVGAYRQAYIDYFGEDPVA